MLDCPKAGDIELVASLSYIVSEAPTLPSIFNDRIQTLAVALIHLRSLRTDFTKGSGVGIRCEWIWFEISATLKNTLLPIFVIAGNVSGRRVTSTRTVVAALPNKGAAWSMESNVSGCRSKR